MAGAISMHYLNAPNCSNPNMIAVPQRITYNSSTRLYAKMKSDFIDNTLPEELIEKIITLMKEVPPNHAAFILFDAFGDKMNNISSSSTPYPHRKNIWC